MMTDTDINVAIAETCGVMPPSLDFYRMSSIPDYCNDLNAMHPVEKKAIENGDYFYTKELSDICGSVVACITATARQRAEAFLKTVGRWLE